MYKTESLLCRVNQLYFKTFLKINKKKNLKKWVDKFTQDPCHCFYKLSCSLGEYLFVDRGALSQSSCSRVFLYSSANFSHIFSIH